MPMSTNSKWLLPVALFSLMLSTSIPVGVLGVSLGSNTQHAMKKQASGGSLPECAAKIASMSCPFAMLESYGCPSAPKANLTSAKGRSDSDGPKASTYQWPIGSVPVGVPINTITREVRYPFLKPIAATVERVHGSKVTNFTLETIHDWIGHMDPEAKNAIFDGKLSPDPKHAYATFFGSFSSLHITRIENIILRATLPDDPEPLPESVDAVMTLPMEYDFEVYEQFIQFFGTHIPRTAGIGGLIQMLTSIKSCFASGNVALVQNQALLELAHRTMQNPTGEKVSQEYLEYTISNTIFMHGGHVEYSKPSQWPERQKSIAEAPVLIEAKDLVELWQFVAKICPVRGANLKRAYEALVASARQAREAAAKSAIAANKVKVTAVTTVDFVDFVTEFSHQFRHCHSFLGIEICHCDWTTACFHPGGCGNDCYGGFSATLVVASQPSADVLPGTSATLSPDGKMCGCPSESDYETPEMPLQNLDQSVTCELNDLGEVRATNVMNPGWDSNGRRTAGNKVGVDGEWVKHGCSVAKATYTGSAWRMTGGADPECGAVTETMTSSGSFTANGYCCIGTGIEYQRTSNYACAGKLLLHTCPKI